MNKVAHTFGMVVFSALVIAIMVTLPSYIIWNWLIPDLFGLREVSLLEMFGLLILTNAMVGSNTIRGAK